MDFAIWPHKKCGQKKKKKKKKKVIIVIIIITSYVARQHVHGSKSQKGIFIDIPSNPCWGVGVGVLQGFGVGAAIKYEF